MYYMCIVSNQLAVTNTNVQNRILSDSLLGNKLYYYGLCKHANMFYETLNSKFKKISVKFMRTSNYVYIFHMFLCLSTYDTVFKFASYVLCILTKFRDFLKPVTVRENT